MARGVDHVVHAVHDLDVAAALYRSLGFQVGARNRHPPSWGTQNHIVQLPGTFIELLTVADATDITPHARNFFSFGAFNRDFLAHEQGLSMLAVKGRGASDADAFRAAGIGDFQVYDFEREGKRPDGTAIKVAFSLAFARNPLAQEIGFFTCQHRFPENFWNAAFQIHRNTAAGLAGVALVAAHPPDHATFLAAMTGERAVNTSSGIAVQTPRGEIQTIDPAAFTADFDFLPPDITRSARLAALRVAVRDLEAAATVLRASGIAACNHMGRLIVGPQSALGATLVFEPLRAGWALR
jgi:hypothetical protein